MELPRAAHRDPPYGRRRSPAPAARSRFAAMLPESARVAMIALRLQLRISQIAGRAGFSFRREAAAPRDRARQGSARLMLLDQLKPGWCS